MEIFIDRRGVLFGTVLFLIISFFLGNLTIVNAEEEISEELEEPPLTTSMTSNEVDNFLFKIRDLSLKAKVLELSSEPIGSMPPPILFGVSSSDVVNSWKDIRSGGRLHDGIDISAPTGSLIVSPIEKSVVTNIGYDRKGGNFVITANPGGEQFYYAHLDRVGEGVAPGQILEAGDLVGYVGSTGNAQAPHLHLGIYYQGQAINPYQRILEDFTPVEKLQALEDVIKKSETGLLATLSLFRENRDLFVEASKETELPENVSSILENEELALTSLSMPENLKLGSKGEGVKLLQDFIIETGTGKKTQALSLVGATGYFGELTKGALIEFQESTGIYPAVGYFGPITKNAMLLGMLTDLNPRSLSNTGVDVSRVSIPYFANHDFEIGSSGDGVEWLQGFLIDESRGRNAIALANTGVTGYFGNLTHRALIEYQDTIGIRPASGYYGPITRELLRIN